MTDAVAEAHAAPEPSYVRLPQGRRKASGLDVNGLSRDEVAADQRRRLQGAMIEAVAAHGYAATTTRELSRLAHVSKEHMYRQFPDKETFFLATYDTIVRCGLQRIGAAYRSPGAWKAKLRAAFEAYATVVASDPKAARLVLVEAFGAGPVAVARMRGTRLVFERVLSASFGDDPDGVPLPPPIAKAIVCGVERITRRRLLAGEVQELPALVDELLAWALSYRSPALTALAAVALEATADYNPYALDRLAVRAENDRARILRAAARIAAADGYARLTPGQIVWAAEVSERRFDELFPSIEQCFLDALDRLGLEALVCAAQAARGSKDPLVGLHRGIVALMRHVARDPVLVRIAFVEIFALGPAGIERRERLLGRFTDELARSLPRSRRRSPRRSRLFAEASVGAIWGVVHHYATQGAAERLPGLAAYATYIALAPAVGGNAAIKAIRDAAREKHSG